MGGSAPALDAIAPTGPLPPLLDALVWQSRVLRCYWGEWSAPLTVSGAVMQSVTRNPLADPFLLGVSSGASTGAVAVLLLGIGGGLSLSAGAFVGALFSFAVLLALIGGVRVSNPARVLLTGVLVSARIAGGARWQPVLLAAIVILVGIVAIQFFASALDAFTFGWDSAAALGVNVTAAGMAHDPHRRRHGRGGGRAQHRRRPGGGGGPPRSD